MLNGSGDKGIWKFNLEKYQWWLPWQPVLCCHGNYDDWLWKSSHKAFQWSRYHISKLNTSGDKGIWKVTQNWTLSAEVTLCTKPKGKINIYHSWVSAWKRYHSTQGQWIFWNEELLLDQCYNFFFIQNKYKKNRKHRFPWNYRKI